MQAGCGTWHQRHARPPAAQLLCTRSTCHTRAYARKQHTGQPSAEQEVGKQSPLTTGHTKELELAGQQIESRNEPNLEHPQPEHQQPGSWRWGASLPACYLPATAIYPSAAAVARTGAQTPPLQYPSPPQQHGNDSQKQTQPITLHPWTYDEPAEAADAAGVRRLEQQRMHRMTVARESLPPQPTVITCLPSHLLPKVLSNAVLLVDKPTGWTADEVVRALRWSLGLKHPRKRSKDTITLGYTHILDATASGLIVVLLGQATVLSAPLRRVPLRYTGVVRLGVSTDTYDGAGRVTQVAPWSHISDEDIQAAAARLQGELVQVPPPVTAVTRDGRPVHQLATRRPAAELRPQSVHITHLSLSRIEPQGQDLLMDVTFAQRGFPRSLAHDIGLVLGCGAHLASLRREAVGGFSVEDAWTLGTLLPAIRRFKGR